MVPFVDYSLKLIKNGIHYNSFILHSLRVCMNKRIQVWLPLLFSITMIAGIFIGYKMRDFMPGRNFFSLEKKRPLQEVMDLIENKYVDTVNFDKLADTAIQAILNKLDPHSVFIPADQLQGVNDDLAGSFYGVGIEFTIIDDTINIMNVLPDGPSIKAGIQVGDKFLKVNDSMVAGVKITETRVRNLLHGDKNSPVKIIALRGNEKKEFTITRDLIPMSSIDASYIIADSTGYIKLGKFTEVSYREFMQAMEALQKQGLKKLILDLRGNGGGILDQAVEIADEFLDGDKLITYTQGSHYPVKEYRCKRVGLFEKGPLVVLADEGSASASEVLIGALQDWDRATIIGRRTFGKGLVQEQYDLSDGSALRLTIARYYTPVGRSIQRPYNNGDKAYYEEINNRFHDGEVISPDSIKNDTSKIFKTVGGRKVFGGGGITPDIFVALDTSGYDNEDAKIYTKGTMETFAYKYFLQNRSQLNTYKSSIDFAKNFAFNDNDWQQFIALATKDSIQLNNISAKQKTAAEEHLKSFLAHELWFNEGFFEVLNTDDNGIKKALETLK
jgi:carboxyl-terminal processing protease